MRIFLKKIICLFTLVFYGSYVTILMAQGLPPKEAYPLEIRQIHSGHSLTDPLFGQPWPGQYVELITHLRGSWAGDDIGASTIPGSPMWWRWENTSGYPDARQNIDEFALLSITEVANLCYEGGSNEQWYLDCIQSQRNWLSTWVNHAWNNGNNGQGAATLLWSNWVNIDNSDGPFREMLDLLGTEWEQMQDYANDNRPSGAPPVYMIPGHRMMARLYDDVQAGLVPGINNFNQFFSDNIHTNALGDYAIAMIHYACIYNQNPSGLPNELIINPPAGIPIPSPALAAYLQNMVWEVVTSYPRTGIYTSEGGVVAAFSASPPNGVAPLSVQFDASASQNNSSAALQYIWDFGDGNMGSGQFASHVFQSPGTFISTLTVSNGNGATNTASKTINVGQPNTQNCTYLAYEPFDYAASSPLHQLAGGSGFLAPWVVQDGLINVPGYHILEGTSLAYDNLPITGRRASGGLVYVSAGRSLDNTPTGSFAGYIAADTDYIGSRTEGQELWLSFLLQKETDDNREASISLHSDPTAWCDLCPNNDRISAGFFGDASIVNGERRWSIQVNDETYTSSQLFEVGNPMLAAVRLVFNSAATEVALFVNPIAGQVPNEPVLQRSTNTPSRIRSLAYYAGSDPGSSQLDEIRLAESYLCAVPDMQTVFSEPPVAQLSASPSAGEAPLVVNFDGSASMAPTGSLRYLWDFGDDTPLLEAGPQVSHTYLSGGGSFTARLTVLSEDNQTAAATATITVSTAAGDLPCLSTITSLQMANCDGEGGQIRINIQNNVSYQLRQGSNTIALTNDHTYSDLSAGEYTLQTQGSNGCHEEYKLHIQVDSNSCPGWNPAPNSMLLATNLNGFADWVPQRPLKNFLKNTRAEPIPYTDNCNCWSFDNNSSQVLAEMNFDPNGYPIGIPQSTSVGSVKLRFFTSADGMNMPPNRNYVLLYEGAGEISLHGTIEDEQQSPGRIQFNLQGDGTFWFQILQSDASNHIRNIRILYLENENDDLAAAPFYEGFIDKIQDFQLLRFMDWMHTNNSSIRRWEDRKNVDYYTYGGQNGVPYEIIIQLANQTKQDIWICVPHAADDDFIYQMATLFRDNLDPDINIFLEYSNEVWNWIFEQAIYNNEENNPLSLNYGRAYAQQSRRVFSIWHEVYGEEACKVKRVLGIQGGFNYLNENILAHISQDDWDFGSPTHYFGLDHGETGNPRLDLLGADATVADVMQNAHDNFHRFSSDIKTDYRNIQLLGKEVITYEGGQHFVGNVFGIPYDYQQAMWDAQNTGAMYQAYQMVLDSISAWGCKLATNYSLVGPQESIFGSWGIMDDIDLAGPYATSAPKYQVHLDNMPSPEHIQAVRNQWRTCIDAPSATEEPIPTDLSQLQIYPNPGANLIQLIAQNNQSLAEIFDVSGKRLIATREKRITTQALAPGIYFIRCENQVVKWVKM